MGTDKGVKLDEGKPRMGLVLGGFADALLEVGRVGTFGAEKYTDNGWQSVENGEERYTDALLRHLLKYKLGEDRDIESGILHLSHVAWNALAILSLHLRNSIATVSEVPSGYARFNPPEDNFLTPLDKLKEEMMTKEYPNKDELVRQHGYRYNWETGRWDYV